MASITKLPPRKITQMPTNIKKKWGHPTKFQEVKKFSPYNYNNNNRTRLIQKSEFTFNLKSQIPQLEQQTTSLILSKTQHPLHQPSMFFKLKTYTPSNKINKAKNHLIQTIPNISTHTSYKHKKSQNLPNFNMHCNMDQISPKIKKPT